MSHRLPQPQLHGPRLHLREVNHNDALALYAIHSDPQVMRYWSYPAWTQLAQAQAKVEEIIRQTGYVPNPQARALALGRNFLIGLIYDNPNAQGAEKVSSLMRPPIFCPDSKPVDELLKEMQLTRSHVVIVVDEFGGTAGLGRDG